jgi:hypothetical protein
VAVFLQEVTMLGTFIVVVCALAIAIVGREAIDRALANAVIGREAVDRMKGSSNTPKSNIEAKAP